MYLRSPSPSLSIFTVAYFIVPQMQKNDFVMSLGEILRGRILRGFLYYSNGTQDKRFSSQLCYRNLLASGNCLSPPCVKQNIPYLLRSGCLIYSVVKNVFFRQRLLLMMICVRSTMGALSLSCAYLDAAKT